MMMKISVIVPIYGTEKYIERSLRSLFSQTMIDGVEFILVNDCTPDSSMEIARKVIEDYPYLKEQVLILEHDVNGGSSAARQSGLDHATGEYLIQIDSDDWCEPTMLEELYRTAERENADIVICDYFVNYPQKQLYRSQPACPTGPECVDQLLRGELHGSLGNKLIKKDLYRNGSIKFVPGLNLWEDLTVVIKLCCNAGKTVYLNRAFLHYAQLNPLSYTSKISEHSLLNIEQSVEEISSFFEAHNLGERYADSLLLFKIAAKNQLLLHTSGSRQRDYVRRYPESNAVILSHPTLPLHYKWVVWFAVHNMLWMSRMIYRTIFCAKKIIR